MDGWTNGQTRNKIKLKLVNLLCNPTKIIFKMPVCFASTFRALIKEGLPGPEFEDASTSADINKDTAPTGNGGDERNLVVDTVQRNEPHEDIKEPAGEQNGAMKQGSDVDHAHDLDQQHDVNVESDSVVSGEKGNQAVLRSSQESAGGDDAHEKTITLRGDGKEATTHCEGSKVVLHVDDDREAGGSKGDLQRNAGSKVSLQPTVSDKTNSEHNNDVNNDSRRLGEKESDTIAPENDEEDKVSLNDTNNIQGKRPPPDNKESTSQPERGDQAHNIVQKPIEIGEKGATATPESDAVRSGDSNYGDAPKRDLEGTGRPNGNEECVTVVFHALLTPTFSINLNNGDKVVLRGDAPFSWHPGKQADMRVVRYILYFSVHLSSHLFLFFSTYNV